MGKRDIRNKETKKPKKDIKKTITATIAPPITSQPVEVVKKKRKHGDGESEEE
jgi:hypothetical protein